MARFISSRLLRGLLVLLVGSFFAYITVRLLPGDPTTTKLGVSATKDSRLALLHQWKLDGPWYRGYGRWLWAALHGDLGKSFAANVSITTTLRQRLLPSLQLMFYAQVIAVSLAVVIGVSQAYRRGRWFDRLMDLVTSVMISVPPFVLGLVLVIWLARKNGFFVSRGYVPVGWNIATHFRLMLLPAVTLAMAPLATYARLLRTDMVATLQEDYILLARSKGLRARYILLRHALKPSLFSLVTAIGLNVGTLIGGAVVVEQTFGISGIGSLIVGSVLQREYLQVQAAFLVVVIIFVLANLGVELLYSVLDPRIRHSSSVR